MNSSTSFEISSETLNVSFTEYDTESGDSDAHERMKFGIVSNDIENPVKKKINQLAELVTKSKISCNAISKMIPILNDTPGSSIEIPIEKKTREKFTHKVIDERYYANCGKCGELNECPSQCISCHQHVDKRTDNYFIYLPIEIQIRQTLIENFNEITSFLSQSSDNGDVHKSLIDQYPGYEILSLTLNIDGGKIIERSSKSLWPMQIYQNYLPPSIRFLPENILVVGIYYGSNHPNTFDLLFPLLNDMLYLEKTGIQLMHSGTQYDFMPLLLSCSCDLIARAMIQNIKHPTGTYACPMCLHEGFHNQEKSSGASCKSMVRIRYGKEKVPSAIRSHLNTIEDAKKQSNGIKGYNCLNVLPYFDTIKCFSTDYMHGSLLGVTKRLIQIWTGHLKVTTSFKALSKSKQNILNQRITSLKPYTRITYKPRSLAEFATYRAIEYKYLLFFYLRYSLNGLLEKKYVDHFERFSAAVYMLCKSTVNENDIILAEELLNDFCDLFEKYYGLSAVTLNVHLLRHYGIVTRNNGPLWVHSLFGFESNMGVLKKYYCGGPHVLSQITEKYITSKSLRRGRNETSEYNITHPLESNDSHNQLLIDHGLKNPVKFAQISTKKGIYKSLASKRTKSVDHFFEMKNQTIGAAVFFVKDSEEFFVVIQEYSKVKQNYHQTEVIQIDKYCVYPLHFIKEKILYLQFATIEVVTTEPNKYEKS